jgi:hypothetical protein
MNGPNTEETRSYLDPMASRLAAAERRQTALAAEFPRVEEVYDGLYERVRELTEEGNRYFTGAEGIIGTVLFVQRGVAGDEGEAKGEAAEEGGVEGEEEGEVWLTSGDRRRLARLDSITSAGERLARHLRDGWELHALLAATFFRSQDKSAEAEVAILGWSTQLLMQPGAGEAVQKGARGDVREGSLEDAQGGAQGDVRKAAPEDARRAVEWGDALRAFTENIRDRLAHGDRAELTLTQEQFVDVLRSKGAWFLTPSTKRNALPKGTIIFKNHRTGVERLTAFALNHRSGCNVLAVIFWLGVLVAVAGLIWWLL